MDTRVAMWVHGVSAFPQRTAGDAGADGPLTQASNVPWSDIVGYRDGEGAHFRGKSNHDNWFHFSVPTPVIIPVFHSRPQPPNETQSGYYGHRIRLERIFVMYRNEVMTGGGSRAARAFINDIQVWDGARVRYQVNTSRIGSAPLRTENGISTVSDDFDGQHHLDIQDGLNSFLIVQGRTPITPEVYWGICISVNIQFVQESEILFAAAGADFLLDVH